ncbi:hypothetical protein KI387_017213, partial [Taxus chinensis]
NTALLEGSLLVVHKTGVFDKKSSALPYSAAQNPSQNHNSLLYSAAIAQKPSQNHNPLLCPTATDHKLPQNHNSLLYPTAVTQEPAQNHNSLLCPYATKKSTQNHNSLLYSATQKPAAFCDDNHNYIPYLTSLKPIVDSGSSQFPNHTTVQVLEQNNNASPFTVQKPMENKGVFIPKEEVDNSKPMFHFTNGSLQWETLANRKSHNQMEEKMKKQNTLDETPDIESQTIEAIIMPWVILMAWMPLTHNFFTGVDI